MTDPKQQIDDFLREEARASDERFNKLLAGLSEADTSRVPEIVSRTPYGSAGRATPSWERQYERARFTEEEKKYRNPRSDMESVEFLRAVSLNDQAKLREIAERPHNRAYHAEWFARADLAEGVGAAGTGGGLVPQGFAGAVEVILSRAARMRGAGLNIVLGGTEYSKKIPTQTVKTVAAVHPEAGDMTSGVTEPIYSSVLPVPVKLGGIIKFSRELLDDSPLMVTSLVTQDIGEAIGVLEDQEILSGSNFSHSLCVDLTTSSLTWSDTTESLTTVVEKYFSIASVLRPRSTWIISEVAAKSLSSITATDGRPMFQEFNPPPRTIDDVEGQVGTLLGRPVMVFSTASVTGTSIFGDLSGYTLYVREPIRVETSIHDSFVTDQVSLRVSRRVDGILSQPTRLIRFP